MDFRGNIFEDWKLDFTMNSNSSQKVFTTAIAETLKGKSKSNHLFYMELVSDRKDTCNTNSLFYQTKRFGFRKI
jgi:hypothetical protein